MKRIDKIRQMSSWELAKFLKQITYCCNAALVSECAKCPLNSSGDCGLYSIESWLEAEGEVQEDA